MLGLPPATEMHRPLPKKAIFEKFKLSAMDRRKFDADISRITIVHEVSPATTTIAPGENATAFYVMLVSLRRAEYDQKNLALLSKLISQNLLFVVEFEGRSRLATVRKNVIQSEWKPTDEWAIKLAGLDFDTVWDNIIIQIGGIEVEPGHTLDEQIAADDARKKLRRRIEQLEQKARSEKQPRRKWELLEEIKRLRAM
ncbi:MAG: DUF4391 domain-containing protein [Candidatus Adiutrix sp.]|jgi:hypothetical protein|nr:DUF4391 domain-containing protein [Candidatus Adiutrix sp.]